MDAIKNATTTPAPVVTCTAYSAGYADLTIDGVGMEAQPTAPATPAISVLAADWPTTAYVPGRYLAASVPGTIDLLVDGRPVTVGLQWDVGGEERPYVADAPEELTLDECEAIDQVVAQAWDAHGREAA